MKKILLSLSSLAIPASHAAITVIDDFTGGTTNAVQTGVGSTGDVATSIPTTATIGGTRVARSHNVAGTGSNTVTNQTTSGNLDWNVDVDTTGHFHLYYGYVNYTAGSAATLWNEAGADHDDLESDMSDQTGITIRVEQADVPSTLRVGLITNRGESNESVVSLEQSVASSFTTQVLTFDFASFTVVEGLLSDFDSSNVDQIIVEAGADLTSADWRLSEISTIPEPSTALLGLVGLLGLARRRR